MKRIMILGGGINQIGLIKAANSEGYYTVLCDKNFNCICRPYADTFYDIDIIDPLKIREIAEQEKVDGIVANTESIMCNLAKVSNELGLVGNPVKSIEILESKSEFREFQKRIGLFSPKQKIVENLDDIEDLLKDFSFPIVVKPVQCSGTRGTARFDSFNKEEINSVVLECINYSRNSVCAIEEYIEMPSSIVLEGDVFLCEGKIFWGGLFFTKRSEKLLMVPMTYMSPYIDSENNMKIIKNSIMKIFSELSIEHGQYNIEAYFDNEGNFFIVEINARQGGHGLPSFVKKAIDVDMDRLLVTTAVKDNNYFEKVYLSEINQCYATRHSVFSNYTGLYKGLFIDKKIKKYVVNIEEDKQINEYVEKRKNGSSVIGFVDLIFDSYEEQHYYSENIEEYIYPVIEPLGIKDIYFDKKYGLLYEEIEEGKCLVWEFSCDDYQIKHMFILRAIESNINNELYDIVSPYGYGGPIITRIRNGYPKGAVVREFEKHFSEYCNNNNIISEFVRFHPICGNAIDFEDVYNSEKLRCTVGTSLKYDNPINMEFSSSCRKRIRRALRDGVSYKIIEKPSSLDEFKDVYYSTMDRNNAAEYYYFDDKYFEKANKYFRDNIVLVEAIYEDNVIAAGFYFVYGDTIHIHLSGTKTEYLNLSPAYVLRYAITMWGIEKGYKLIHHGGGRTNSSDDSLYMFKKQFGQKTSFDFYVGKKIWNVQKYKELCIEKNVTDNAEFFPAYRKRT